MNNNLSLKFKLEVVNYKLSRTLKDLKYLYRKHDIYNKIISSKYNIIHRFLVYLEFKGVINNKHNHVNNSDTEYVKNIMQSIIKKYE